MKGLRPVIFSCCDQVFLGRIPHSISDLLSITRITENLHLLISRSLAQFFYCGFSQVKLGDFLNLVVLIERTFWGFSEIC